MKKQCVVIGLGFFGMTIAKSLSEQGVEVLAIDSDMKAVERASKYVTKAVCLDVTDDDAMEALPLDDFDYGIVAMGENIAVSVIACMTLKDSGVNTVIAKVGNRMHRKVLEKVGVDEIIFPEEYMGKVIADKIIEKK